MICLQNPSQSLEVGVWQVREGKWERYREEGAEPRILVVPAVLGAVSLSGTFEVSCGLHRQEGAKCCPSPWTVHVTE